MLFLVADLIELFRAAMNRAGKWFFRGMYSQMIEEVVPFPKELATEAVVTSEDTREPSSKRIGEFDLAKTLCVGNMYLILKDGEIYGLSVHGDHLSFFRQAEPQPNALFNVDSRILQRVILLLLRRDVYLRHLKNTVVTSQMILEHSSCLGLCLSRPCEAVVKVCNYASCRRRTTFISKLRTIAC